jgi:hypothetical protein
MPVADADILWLEPEPEAEQKPVHPAASGARREPRNPISLAQLLASSVLIEWHDAVAIMSQLADQVLVDKRHPPSGALPAIGAIQLESDGRVHAHLTSNASESLSAGFGRVLQALLQDKPTPANLRLLAWRTTTDVGISLDEMRAELARWERPGRVDKLKDLYERARGAGPRPSAAPSVPSVALASLSPATTRPSSRDVEPHPARRIAPAIAAAIVCVALGGTAAWLYMRPIGVAQDRPRSAAPTAPAARADADQPLQNRRVRRPAPLGAARVEEGRPVQMAQQARRSDSNADVGSLPLSPPLEPRATGPSPSAVNNPAANADRAANPNAPGVLSQPVSPQPGVSVVPDLHLYKSGDAGVTEPVLVKPYLPPRPHPPIPDSALGVLEVVVDAHGRVESVHLKSPANRFREKWWLFTAKDWQFEPARKNGMPVRFLNRILLTDLNIGEPQ